MGGACNQALDSLLVMARCLAHARKSEAMSSHPLLFHIVTQFLSHDHFEEIQFGDANAIYLVNHVMYMMFDCSNC